MRLGLLDNEYEVCETCPILEATEGGQEPAVWERDRLLEEYGSEVPSVERVDIDLFNELGDRDRVRKCLQYRNMGKCPLIQTMKVEM